MDSNLLAKSNLSPEQLVLLQSEFDKKKKSKTIAYLLWFFTGAFGGHRFYAGDTIRGICMLLTLGGIGIWALIDVFFIGSRIEEKNNGLESNILQDVLAIAASKKEALSEAVQ
jgi:TM2 domain-containing membrane protein YozV